MGASKNSIEVTKPSAFGEAIAPNVPAYNDKPKGTRKPKKEVNETKPAATLPVEKAGDSEDETKSVESISLAERIAKKGNKQKSQSKLSFSAGGNKAEAKAVTDDDIEAMDEDPITVPQTSAPITRPTRVSKKKVDTYANEDDSVEEFDSEDDFILPKKKALPKSKSSSSLSSNATGKTSSTESGKGKSKKAPSKPQPQKLDMSDNSDDEDSFIVPKPSGKSAPRGIQSSDEDESFSPPAKKPAPKKATVKNIKKSVIDLVDVLDDEEVLAPPPKKKPATKTEKPKTTKTKQPAKKASEKAAPKRKTQPKTSQKTLLDMNKRVVKRGKAKVPSLDDLLNDQSDDDTPPSPKKPAPKKSAPKQKVKSCTSIFNLLL